MTMIEGQLDITDLADRVKAMCQEGHKLAGCTGGAMQRDPYLEVIELAGFEIAEVRGNDYRFVSVRVANASQKHGAATISLLAQRREA
jgi:hypothetical protein